MKRSYFFSLIVLVLLSLLLRFAMPSRPDTGRTSLPAPAPPTISNGVALPELPPTVAGLPLVNFYSGEPAIRDILRLHNNDFPLLEGVIARYGEGDREATVWISVSPDEQEAALLMELMVTKMPESPVFSEEENFQAAGTTLYFVTGMGMNHYYWLDGLHVYWLAVGNDTGHDVVRAFIAD
jgi:hypothetical protein